MVSMATHFAILKNEGLSTKILISQQQFILENYTVMMNINEVMFCICVGSWTLRVLLEAKCGTL